MIRCQLAPYVKMYIFCLSGCSRIIFWLGINWLITKNSIFNSLKLYNFIHSNLKSLVRSVASSLLMWKSAFLSVFVSHAPLSESLTSKPVLKSDNLQYNMVGPWVAGTNDSSTKHLMFQALLFFHNLLKTLKLWNNNNIWKIRRLVDESFVPATQQTSVLYCRLLNFWRVAACLPASPTACLANLLDCLPASQPVCLPSCKDETMELELEKYKVLFNKDKGSISIQGISILVKIFKKKSLSERYHIFKCFDQKCLSCLILFSF